MDQSQQLEIIEAISCVKEFNVEYLADRIPTHARRMNELIASGKLSTCQYSFAGIATASLKLAQIAYVVDNDLSAAHSYLNIALRGDLGPHFDASALLIKESINNKRLWDGIQLSLDSHTERLLCYVLTNRVSDASCEYAAIDDPRLFLQSDETNIRAIFNRHLIYAIQERYDRLDSNDYVKAPVKRSVFFHGAHLALVALANGDEATFADEIRTYSSLFIKRKKSKHIDMTWGYGVASHFCFDVVGAAIYRLALRRGLRFETPDERMYPRAFWASIDPKALA